MRKFINVSTVFTGSYSDAVDFCRHKFFVEFGVMPSKSSIRVISCFDKVERYEDGDFEFLPMFKFLIIPNDGRSIPYLTTHYGVQKEVKL